MTQKMTPVPRGIGTRAGNTKDERLSYNPTLQSPASKPKSGDLAALAASNSLTDLAARIQAEHVACVSAFQRGLEHAVAAGKLLLEAKGQIPHGQWLPWLREHVKIPERTAQRYMKIAPWAADIKSDTMADLTADPVATLTQLLPPDQPTDQWDWDKAMTWMGQRLDAPFTMTDIKLSKPGDFDLFKTKLMRQIGLPALASYCVEMREDDLDTLRLCPHDDVMKALEVLAPIVNGERGLPVYATDMISMRQVIGVAECTAMSILGGFLKELEFRCSLDTDEKYEAYKSERTEIHAEMMKRLEKKMEEFNATAGRAWNSTRRGPSQCRSV